MIVTPRFRRRTAGDTNLWRSRLCVKNHSVASTHHFRASEGRQVRICEETLMFQGGVIGTFGGTTRPMMLMNANNVSGDFSMLDGVGVAWIVKF